MAEVGLADVIRALRSEIQAAIEEGKGQRVQFEATAINVEFQVGVTTTKEGKGGIHFWVFELGGGGSRGNETIQKVTLSLQPVLESGERVKIAEATEQDPLSTKSPSED